MHNRIESFDLIRSFAILTVFFDHAIMKDPRIDNTVAHLAITTLSPGLTMSLLGFISAALLSPTMLNYGPFLIKRFTRIYIPLALCLSVVLSLYAYIGKQHLLCQHTLLHYLGLTAFIEILAVDNKSPIGAGLWFITIIMTLYLLLPLLAMLFRHRNGLMHLILIIIVSTVINNYAYGTQSAFNVIISFSVGSYVSIHGLLDVMYQRRILLTYLFCASLLTIVALSTSEVIPYAIRGLMFSLYPLAFVPLFSHLSEKIPRYVIKASGFFAGLSYEFYILHFYFINNRFRDFFHKPMSVFGQITISFSLTLVLAYIISYIAKRLRESANTYLIPSTSAADIHASG